MTDDEADVEESEDGSGGGGGGGRDSSNHLPRKLLISGGALLGLAAVYNAFARKGVAPLTNLIGGEEGNWRWRGRRVAFTKHGGSGGGPSLLLIHGIHAAAWSYEWRHNVDHLARTHTVYTIDLLGFGKSDRPPIQYTARLYTSLISDFCAQVVNEPCVLVANSLSAAYAIILAARDPHRFPSLVLIQPTGLTRLNNAPGATGDASRFAIDTPVVGTAAFNALVSGVSLRHYLEQVYSDDKLVSKKLLDVYYRTTHQRGARHAPAAFISGHLNIDVRRALRRLSQPAMLVWGEEARMAPVDEARGFRALKPDFYVNILSPAGDLPHDERAEEFNVIVSTWLTHQLPSSEHTPDTHPGTHADLRHTSQL